MMWARDSNIVELRNAWSAIACVSAFAILGTIHASAATGSGSGLFDVSRRFVSAFNSGDANRIRSMMTPELKAKYTEADILSVIVFCKKEKLSDIVRTSLPVSGTKYYGFFAVYGLNAMSSMMLEVDPKDRIVFWVMDDDLDGDDLGCSLTKF